MVELIAHRAGNDWTIDEPARALVDRVEIDVHLHKGDVVVRHAKRLWGTSRLWDRWYLLPSGLSVPRFDERLVHLGDDVGLWVDCKGITPKLPTAVLEALNGDVTLSTKSWWSLGGVSGRDGVRLVRSAGNRFELLLLRRLPSRVELDGVVVHSRLLDELLIEQLRERFGAVFSWSVPDADTGRRLIDWGVQGLIIDEPSVMAALQEHRATS